jgi:hypothetical protein
MPSRPARRSVARRRVTVIAKRAGRRARRVVREGAVPTSMLLGSAGLGYAQAKGWLNKIPTIGGSRALSIGVAGYAVTRLTTNPTARMVGKVAMLVGAFDFGSKQGGGKSALEGDDDEWLEGDDDEDVEGEEDEI